MGPALIAVGLTFIAVGWFLTKLDWIMNKCPTEIEGWKVLGISLLRFLLYIAIIWIVWAKVVS
jgi:hypothetical protein